MLVLRLAEIQNVTKIIIWQLIWLNTKIKENTKLSLLIRWALLVVKITLPFTVSIYLRKDSIFLIVK